MNISEFHMFIIFSPWLPLVAPSNHNPSGDNKEMLNFEAYFQVFYPFFCMKVSELQMSIIASPWLPLIAPSNHIPDE